MRNGHSVGWQCCSSLAGHFSSSHAGFPLHGSELVSVLVSSSKWCDSLIAVGDQAQQSVWGQGVKWPNHLLMVCGTHLAVMSILTRYELLQRIHWMVNHNSQFQPRQTNIESKISPENMLFWYQMCSFPRFNFPELTNNEVLLGVQNYASSSPSSACPKVSELFLLW